jgi:hypothetical protein
MNLNLANHFKERGLWIDLFWYGVMAATVIVVVCYVILEFKVYFYTNKINQLNDKIAAYSTPEEKAYEKEVFGYKKKIDDFTTLLASHRISSNIFSFIENNTLPNVWFSSFTMTSASNEIRLSGEAETMEALSRQFKIFETSKDYIKGISVLNSQVSSAGRINFILNVTLDPKIFTYK